MRRSWPRRLKVLRRAVRADPQLHRLPDDPAGARDGARGELGEDPLVQVEYAQDWLSENLEETGQKQAGWRTDPARSGSRRLDRRHRHPCLQPGKLRLGPRTRELCADLDSFVEGRKLDDNGHVLMRFAGGAKGMLWCSQVAPGNENALKLGSTATKGRARMGPGRPELSLARTARRTEAPAHPQWRRRNGRRPARQPHPGRSSRRLSRRLRHHLQ
jgi:hypothetical protein